jgi:hypothetical protein
MTDLARRRFLTAAGTALAAAPLARLTFMDIGQLGAVDGGPLSASITLQSIREAVEAMRAAYVPGPYTMVLNRRMYENLRALNMLPPRYVVDVAVIDAEGDA